MRWRQHGSIQHHPADEAGCKNWNRRRGHARTPRPGALYGLALRRRKIRSQGYEVRQLARSKRPVHIPPWRRRSNSGLGPGCCRHEGRRTAYAHHSSCARVRSTGGRRRDSAERDARLRRRTFECELSIVDIEALAPNGDGIATSNGRRLTVPFTIPGERVRIRVVERGRAPAVVSLVEILRASPHRVTPRCRHFGLDAKPGVGPCGGCTWQHIAYPEQLRFKTQLVDRLVRGSVPDAPATLPTLAATALDQPWGYRHKVHFVCGNRGSTLTMGHYVRGSRRVIPVVECPVHDERGNAFAFCARDTFAA